MEELDKANELLFEGNRLFNAGNFEEAIKRYKEAEQLAPNDEFILINLGITLSRVAEINKDEALFNEAIDKHKKVIKSYPDNGMFLRYLGCALSGLAKIKKEVSLFEEAIEKFKEAIEKNQDNTSAFNNWGNTLSDLAEISKDKNEIEKLFDDFCDKSKYLGKNIFEILVFFNNEKTRNIIIEKLFYPLLESTNSDSEFFNETVKGVDKNELDKYKDVYILSLLIISQLHVKNERFVAHYCKKTLAQKILFEENAKYQLNTVHSFNDPTEGKTLFDYLFGGEEHIAKEISNIEYRAFASCFTFNPDSLNQFRLYGKEGDKEGTGLSLVFNKYFFSAEPETAIKPDPLSSTDKEKHALFRCIYIDPLTQRVETVGQKEYYLFYRERSEKETDNDIKKRIDDYHKYIADIIVDVKKKMEKLKELVKGLDQRIVSQLLINLQYLIKHVAFKEEQECRIVKTYRLDNKKIKPSDDFNRMYVEYEPEVSKYVKEIYFGPKATGIELFQDMLLLIHKNLEIPCIKSRNPLA